MLTAAYLTFFLELQVCVADIHPIETMTIREKIEICLELMEEV